MSDNKLFRRTAMASAISALTIAVPQWSFAANAMLEEVTVTASRRAESTMDVPYNISATTAEQLEQQGITDFAKLARNVAGLTYIESGARNAGINSGLVVRGLNTRSAQSDDIKSLASPTVSTYVGETPLFVNLHLKDIERVEVLRGPQGTLYGSGSLGRTIRNMPFKPDTQEFAADISTRLSQTKNAAGFNSDTYGMVNIPLGDSVALRVVGGYVENQGFVDANSVMVLDANNRPTFNGPNDFSSEPVTKSVGDSNGDTVKHVRASLLWDITDNASALLTHQRQKDRAEGVQGEGGVGFGGGEYAHANRFLEPLDREVELTALDLEVDLGFAVLSSSTSHFTNEAKLISDQSGIYLNNDFWYDSGYNIGPRDNVYGDYSAESEAIAQEFRLVSTGDGPLSWVGGVYYQDMEETNVNQDLSAGWWEYMGFPEYWTTGYTASREELAGVGVTEDVIYQQTQTTTFSDKAIFGELSYRFTDRFQATLGARWFEQDYEANGVIYLPVCGIFCSNDYDENTVTGNPLGLSGGTLQKTFKDVITKVNFSYDINEEMSAYFTRAEGFRRGGTNGIPTTDVVPGGPFSEDPALKHYDPDFAVTWALGMKGTAGESVKFSAALFLIEWDDIQIDMASPEGAFPIVVNGKTAESKGVELEATWGITDNLTLTSGYAYTKAQLTADFDVGGAGEKTGKKGDSLPNVPEHSGSVSANYYLPLDSGNNFIFNLGMTAVSSAQSDLNEDSPDYSEYAGYALWNTSMALENDSWKVTVFVDNLANKHALTNPRGARYTNVQNSQSGRDQYGFINKPRTVGASLKYSF